MLHLIYRHPLAGQRVQVYRNLKATAQTGPWSIRQNGLVIGYSNDICLEQVLFHVSRGGRLRVRAEGQRAVHAWASGLVVRRPPPAPECPTLVRYDPYLDCDSFYDPTGQPVYTARFAHFHQPPGTHQPGCFILSSDG